MAVRVRSIGIASGGKTPIKSTTQESYNRKFVKTPGGETITEAEKNSILGGIKTREQRAAEEILKSEGERKAAEEDATARENKGLEAARALKNPIDPNLLPTVEKEKGFGRKLLEGYAEEYGNTFAPGLMGMGAAKEQAIGFTEDWQKQLGKNMLEAGIGGLTAIGSEGIPLLKGALRKEGKAALGKATKAGEATQAIIQKNKKEAAKLLGKLENSGAEAMAGKTAKSLEAQAGKTAGKKVTDVITHTSQAKEILKGKVIQNIVAGLKNPIVVGGIIASSLGMTSWGLWSKGEVMTDLTFTRQKAIDNGDYETADYIGQLLEEATDEALWEKMKTLMPYIGLVKWEGKRVEAIRLKNQQLDTSQDKELQKTELRITEERKKIQNEAIMKARLRAEEEAYGDFGTDEPIQR
jgi:hypothetical protein